MSSFWPSQPVGVTDADALASRIEPYLAEEPMDLPKGRVWDTLDLRIPEVRREVRKFMLHHNVTGKLEDGRTLGVLYTENDMQVWCSGRYVPEWCVGMRSRGNLVGVIIGLPTRLRISKSILPYNVESVDVDMDPKKVDVEALCVVHFCVHKLVRRHGIAQLMIQELARRMHTRKVHHAIYGTPEVHNGCLGKLRVQVPIKSLSGWLSSSHPMNCHVASKEDFGELQMACDRAFRVKNDACAYAWGIDEKAWEEDVVPWIERFSSDEDHGVMLASQEEGTNMVTGTTIVGVARYVKVRIVDTDTDSLEYTRVGIQIVVSDSYKTTQDLVLACWKHTHADSAVVCSPHSLERIGFGYDQELYIHVWNVKGDEAVTADVPDAVPTQLVIPMW